ncbi:MAG: yigE [Segetibacter sp.]|nr:yigE [Segetibacter sp.]
MQAIEISLIILVSGIITVNSCNGQRKIDENSILIQKKNMPFKEISKKYRITVEMLRELNPLIKGDTAHKNDTIFIAGASKLLKEETLTTYSEQRVDKKGMFKKVNFQGKRYFICEANPHLYKFEIFNVLNNNNQPTSFSFIENTRTKKLIYAVNAGMYEQDLTPVGLFISEGKTYKNINRIKAGKGNFYELSPNGVFFLDTGENAHIVATEKYNDVKYKPYLATQSGPLLIIDGVFNSHFNKNSPNALIRNGVGINKKSNVVFVVSEDPVTFFELSELFRNRLGCDNALYLDGAISQYYAPEVSGSNPKQRATLGTILTVSDRIANSSDRDSLLENEKKTAPSNNGETKGTGNSKNKAVMGKSGSKSLKNKGNKNGRE